MQAIRMCTLGRCGPWRSGLTLTVSANRNTVRCPVLARLMQTRCSEVQYLTPRGFIRGPCDVMSSECPEQPLSGKYSESHGAASYDAPGCPSTVQGVQWGLKGRRQCHPQHTMFYKLTDYGEWCAANSGELLSFPQALEGSHTWACVHVCAHTVAHTDCSQLHASLGFLSMVWLLTADCLKEVLGFP